MAYWPAEGRALAMSFFDLGPNGRWPFLFNYEEDLGCAYTLIGFILFLGALAVLWRLFFF
jgi:hypothetical protein